MKDFKKLQELIKTSLKFRLSTFDHSNIYGNYTTEKLFGNAFSEMKIKSEDGFKFLKASEGKEVN